MNYRIIQTWYGLWDGAQKTQVRFFKYYWTARLYKFWHYDMAEPVFRASCEWDIKKTGDMQSWAVDVFDDTQEREHRRYCVPAISGDGAMLLAFILDKGLPNTAYGDGGYLEPGVMELAKTHCRVVSVEEY